MTMKPLECRNRKLWTLMVFVGALLIIPQGIYAEEVPAESQVDEITEDDLFSDLDKNDSDAEAEAESESEIPVRDTNGPGTMTWIAMMLLGAAAFGALVLMKKRQKTNEGGRPLLAVLNTVRIGGKHQLSLIEVPGKLLVVGVTEKGLSTLAEINQELPEEPSENLREEAPPIRSNRNAMGEELVHDDPQENRALMDRILHIANQKKTTVVEEEPRDLTNDSNRREVLRRLEEFKELRVNN
jgi:flagellar biogenesis protein FliO